MNNNNDSNGTVEPNDIPLLKQKTIRKSNDISMKKEVKEDINPIIQESIKPKKPRTQKQIDAFLKCQESIKQKNKQQTDFKKMQAMGLLKEYEKQMKLTKQIKKPIELKPESESESESEEEQIVYLKRDKPKKTKKKIKTVILESSESESESESEEIKPKKFISQQNTKKSIIKVSKNYFVD